MRVSRMVGGLLVRRRARRLRGPRSGQTLAGVRPARRDRRRSDGVGPGNVTWGPKAAEELVLLEELRAFAGDDRTRLHRRPRDMGSACRGRRSRLRRHRLRRARGHFVETVAGDHAAAEDCSRGLRDPASREQPAPIASISSPVALRTRPAQEAEARAGTSMPGWALTTCSTRTGCSPAARSWRAERVRGRQRLVRRGVSCSTPRSTRPIAPSRLDLAEVLRLADGTTRRRRRSNWRSAVQPQGQHQVGAAGGRAVAALRA
jgi:hypothetical protein